MAFTNLGHRIAPPVYLTQEFTLIFAPITVYTDL
jgi:hypothetical protein